MRHFKLTILAAMLFVLLAGLFVQSGAARAASSRSTITCSGKWNQVSSPNVGSSVLYGVAAISTSDVWAVGSGTNSSSTTVPLAEHWNGTSWSISSVPNPSSNGAILQGAAAVSTSAVWAVGYSFDKNFHQKPFIEHWNGSSWSIATSPSVSGSGMLSSVTAISAMNVWAVGNVLPSTGLDTTLIEHYNGTSWSIVASPNPPGQNAELFGVSAYSGKNIWAVGEQYNTGGVTTTLIEHYNGTSWSIVASPNVSNALFTVLKSVVATASSTAWAVGISGNNGGTVQTVIEKWNGTSWSLVSSPNATAQSYLYGVAAASTTNVRAVGSAYNGSISQTLTEHWNGTSWNIVSAPAPNNSGLESIGHVPGTKNFWAVGFSLNGSNDQTLTEYYC